MLEELLSEWPKIAIGFVGGIGLLYALGNTKQKSTIQSIEEKQQALIAMYRSALREMLSDTKKDLKALQTDLGKESKKLQKRLVCDTKKDLKALQTDLGKESKKLQKRFDREKACIDGRLTVASERTDSRIQKLSDRFDLISRTHADDSPDELQAAFNGYCVAETSNKTRCSNKAQQGKLICALHDGLERAISIYPPIRDQIPEHVRNSINGGEVQLWKFITDDKGYLKQGKARSEINTDAKGLTAYLVKGEGQLPDSPTGNLKVLSALMDVETGKNGQIQVNALQLRDRKMLQQPLIDISGKRLHSGRYWKMESLPDLAGVHVETETELLRIAPEDFVPVKSGKRQLKVVSWIVPEEMKVTEATSPNEISVGPQDMYQVFQPARETFEYCGCRLSYADQSIDHFITNLCWTLFTDSDIFQSHQKKRGANKGLGRKETRIIKNIAGNTNSGKTGDFLASHFKVLFTGQNEAAYVSHHFKHSFIPESDLSEHITLWRNTKGLAPKKPLEVMDLIFELLTQENVISNRDLEKVKGVSKIFGCAATDIDRVITERVQQLQSPQEYFVHKGKVPSLDVKKILVIEMRPHFKSQWKSDELETLQDQAVTRAGLKGTKMTREDLEGWEYLNRTLSGAILKYV